MPKFTYTVTAPNGQTFSRKSDRAYTHAVISRADWAAERDAAANPHPQLVRTLRSNYDYALRELGPVAKYGHTEAQLAALRDDIDGCTNVDQYLTKKRAEAMARVEARAAKPNANDWGVEGYCGRLDLAAKLQAKGGWGRKDFTIVEVVAR